MKEKPGVQILKIKLSSHSRGKNHREFQSFAFMDRHDLHSAGPCPGKIYLSKIHLVFLQAFDIADKIKQSSVTCLFVVHGPLHQHMQIRPSLASAGKSAHILFISCDLQNMEDELMYRRIGRHIPDLFQLFQKTADFLFQAFLFILFGKQYQLPVSGKGTEAFIEKPARTFAADQRHLLGGTAAERRMEHSRKRNILKRIVAYPEIIEQSHNLGGGEISCPGNRIGRNPLGFQDPAEGFRPAGGAP